MRPKEDTRLARNPQLVCKYTGVVHWDYTVQDLELERQQSAYVDLAMILGMIMANMQGWSRGLIMTTVAGFVTLIGSAVAYFGLPTLVARDLSVGKSWWSIAFSSGKSSIPSLDDGHLLVG